MRVIEIKGKSFLLLSQPPDLTRIFLCLFDYPLKFGKRTCPNELTTKRYFFMRRPDRWYLKRAVEDLESFLLQLTLFSLIFVKYNPLLGFLKHQIFPTTQIGNLAPKKIKIWRYVTFFAQLEWLPLNLSKNYKKAGLSCSFMQTELKLNLA